MTSSGGGPTDLDSPVRVVVDAVAAHFRVALRDLGLTAPASTVGVALHPAARHGDDTVRVLVWCDPPDGAEIITADLPHGWAARSATEVAHLVAAVIATGLTRLASARGWDLGEALDIFRAAVEQEFGTGTEPWQVVGHAEKALHPGGIILAYTPTIIQAVQFRERLVDSSFELAETIEVLQRGWNIDGMSVRPDHRMVAHTGFLTHARLLPSD